MSLYDWSKAPQWANWVGINKDGSIYFFERKPARNNTQWTDPSGGRYTPMAFSKDLKWAKKWWVTLDERPKNIVLVPKDEEKVKFAENPIVAQMQSSGNKYHRMIKSMHGFELGLVDVYCVLRAFDVTEPAIQHAIKKLLCAGLRGKGDVKQDLKEAIDAINAAIDADFP